MKYTIRATHRAQYSDVDGGVNVPFMLSKRTNDSSLWSQTGNKTTGYNGLP